MTASGHFGMAAYGLALNGLAALGLVMLGVPWPLALGTAVAHDCGMSWLTYQRRRRFEAALAQMDHAYREAQSEARWRKDAMGGSA